MDQGYAETTLVTQMRTIIFRALPTPYLEFSVRGWQMAWYLVQVKLVFDLNFYLVRPKTINHSPLNGEGYDS